MNNHAFAGLLAPVFFLSLATCAHYTPYQYDNGDDYYVEGLRRVVDTRGNIGYEDEAGILVISPRYKCAFPFMEGKAKVADICETREVPGSRGEHHEWVSDNWYFIDRNGRKAVPQ